MTEIEYFFTPISGYAYLGHAALLRLAAEREASIRFRPMDTLKLFAAIEVTPPPKQPYRRLRYRQTDMERWAACRRLPLVTKPRFWPADATLGACAIIAAQDLGADAGLLAGALLSAVWAGEVDISDADSVAALAGECGLDANAILAAASSMTVVQRYAENTADAIARGVLGSPTFFVGEAMFFGQDRLTFVDQMLRDSPSA